MYMCDLIVYNMTMKDLVYYVTEDMQKWVDSLTFSDVLNEIKYTLDESMLDEFVTTIKGQIK